VAAVKTYNATATREGRWWVVDVPDIGVTQGRSSREAERMAADLVAIMLDIPVEQVSVNVDFRLSDELTNEVYIARQAQKDADKAQRQAADRSRAAIRRILAAGLSKQDAARVLGISAQRVSQLVPEPRQKPV
jgi:DNA-directed RNA polymerase specialized sigma24 family protein